MLVSRLVIHCNLINVIRHALRVHRPPTIRSIFLQRNIDDLTHCLVWHTSESGCPHVLYYSLFGTGLLASL